MSVPRAFRDAVEKAKAAGRPGDLRLLSWEIHDLDWAEEGQLLAAQAKLDIDGPIPPGRVLLFTGHMIDAPDRKEPRFPAAQEKVARDAIEKAIANDREVAGKARLGIAGGASGGDILFHEVCGELGIPTHVYLAMDREDFLDASVRKAGGNWEERFDALVANRPVFQLGESKELPGWLAQKKGYDFWQRNNQWMLQNAFAESGDNVAIIALWDHKEGDGPGGTGHLVQEALSRGASPQVYDTRELFGL
jgi:hypothetical protein